jgi:hypothetical protein
MKTCPAANACVIQGKRQPGKFRETAHGQDAVRRQRPARAVARPAHPLAKFLPRPVNGEIYLREGTGAYDCGITSA